MTTAGADIASVYHARRSRLPRAVLFDLDDTLFDHEASARGALAIVREAFECFTRLALAELEQLHGELLERLHQRVVAGDLGLDEARIERFRLLLAAAGDRDADRRAVVAAQRYRAAYLAARRPIAGAAALLGALQPRVHIGVVSNNLLEEQQQKLAHCGLAPFVRALVVSEEAGVSKPDAAIFRLALARLECEADEAVMVGDSWANDVAGAMEAGIRAVWFNRRAAIRPDPGCPVPELRSLEPTPSAVQVILQAHLQADRAHRD